MKTRSFSPAAFVSVVVAAAVGFSACGDDTSAADGSGGTSGSSGSAGEPGQVVCGGRSCPGLPASVVEQGITQCCTASDECANSAPYLDGECYSGDGAGSKDSACPTTTFGDVTLEGCCTPEGFCGALDPTLVLGCLPGDLVGVAQQACTGTVTPPGSACTLTFEAPCDGPEDCATGEVCCGRFTGSVYDQFECSSDCDTSGTSFFEMCHSDADCTNPLNMCGATTAAGALPDYLFRCFSSIDGPPTTTAGPGVECGGTVCATGEVCCVTDPQPPECVAAGACACDET